MSESKDTQIIPANTERMKATLAGDESVSQVRLVSPARARVLAKMGIMRVRDLVTHYPRRYIDLSSIETVASARIGSSCTIEGVVHDVKLKRPRPRLVLVEIGVVDKTGICIVTAFRQPWLAEKLESGMRVAIAGKVEFNYGYKRMTNPFIEVIENESDISAGRIIPVHPATEKLSAAWMRRLIENALCDVGMSFDPLPLSLRAKRHLMSRSVALRCIHFPKSMDEADEARARLAYEELLFLELFLMMNSQERARGKRPVMHVIDGIRVQALEQALPFTLTADQSRARDEMLAELAAGHVANHLILGDVGNGKTVVSAFALAAAVDSGNQACLMAPTEVLARQHLASLRSLFDAAHISYALLTSATPAAEKESIYKRFSSGELEVLIGTHALIEDKVAPHRLSLAIIDEQQRFGVDQRARLLNKGEATDAIYLTATPIPRSLALAVFGDLTLSYIKQRPHAGVQRTTKVYAKSQQGEAYDAARAALERGEQVYVVCPLVGKDTETRESASAARNRDGEEAHEEDLHPHISIESDDDFANDNISAATQEARYLQHSVFGAYEVALLHGKMSSTEKQQVMSDFREGRVQVLVATTVIEVGVDVPNATVMIIQDADRFGLSQLHQLRGRVGRGEKPGEVFLISASKSDTALARLGALEATDDGFELAAFDLSLRREGDILGNRQSGTSSLKLVNIMRDKELIEAAHSDARALLESDPELTTEQNRALAREIRLAFKDEHVQAGG